MIKVTTYFDKHRIAVVTYFEEKKPACMPAKLWCILLLYVHEIAGIADISCKSLQGHITLMCNQHHTLKRLVLNINRKVGIVGSLSEVQRNVISDATHQIYNSTNYSVSFVAVRVFMEDLGLFVKDIFTAMDNRNCDMLLQLSAADILRLVDVISAVVAERNKDNEDYIDAATSVLSHQLVRILPHNFSIYLQRNRERLELIFTIEDIDNIGRQHKALCDLYRRQPVVKISIVSFDKGTAYRYAWNGLHKTYLFLERFVGGLATIFPSTSTV